jgi:anion-transporting  ArsA/GET3 family ATPase
MSKLMILCGTGGVGKTSLSAIMGLRAALSGARVAMMTIDPSRRLASTLGLQSLDAPSMHDLTPALKKLSPQAGSLVVSIPQVVGAFDRLVKRFAPDGAVREKIMINPIYRAFSSEFTGAEDILALARILELARGNADVVIIDTPPSRDFLSFLKAPEALLQFFQDPLLSKLSKVRTSFFTWGLNQVLSWMERLTGAQFLNHFLDFSGSLAHLQKEIAATLAELDQLLKGDQASFFLVTTPIHDTLSHQETHQFADQLTARGLSFKGFILNRSLLKREPNSLTHPGVRLFEEMRVRERHWIDQATKEGLPIEGSLGVLTKDLNSMEDLADAARLLEGAWARQYPLGPI